MKKLIEKIKKYFNIGNVAKNVSWIILQNIYTMILGLLTTSIVARSLGTSGYGTLNFCLSYVALFSFIAIFGTNHIILKDLSEKKYDSGIVLGTNFGVRVVLSLISLIISQIVSFILYRDINIQIIVLLFNINTILSSCDVISYYAQSKIENKYISISKIISTTIFSVIKVVFALCKASIVLYAMSYIIETIIYSILLVISYNKIKDNNVRWSFDKNYMKLLLNSGKYYAFSSLMITIYLRIDQVMLGSFFSDKSAVGIYSAAVRISEIWTFVPLAIITSYKPVVIKSKNISDEQYYNNLKYLYNFASLMCFLFVICICIFGKIGIYVLYGNGYMEAYIPLLILTFGVWIGVLGNIHFIWMTCTKNDKYSIIYSVTGCIVNVVLNFILIPKIGIIGAAIATLISQIFSNIISFMFVKEARKISIMLIKSLNPIYSLKNVMLRRKNEQ